MNKRKYPFGLFITGIVLNVFVRFWWLLVIGIGLCIAAIFFAPCLYFGIAVIAIDIILSFAIQLRYRSICLRESDAPDFQAFQDALARDGNWESNVKDFVEDKVKRHTDDK